MLKYSHTPYLNLNFNEEDTSIKDQNADTQRKKSLIFENFSVEESSKYLKSSSSSDVLSTNSEHSSANNVLLEEISNYSRKSGDDEYEHLLIIETNSSEEFNELWKKSHDVESKIGHHQEDVYFHMNEEIYDSNIQATPYEEDRNVRKKESRKSTKSSSKISKFTKTTPTMQRSEQASSERIEITVTINDENKGDSRNINEDKKYEEERYVSENEDYQRMQNAKPKETKQKGATRKPQSSLHRKSHKVLEKFSSNPEKGQNSASGFKDAKRSTTTVAEKTTKKSIRVDLNGKESTDDASNEVERKKIKRPKNKNKKRTKKQMNLDCYSKNITEIKKADSVFSINSNISETSSNFEDNLLWANETKARNQAELKPINPMDQISIQCKKMFKDLLVEEDAVSLSELMEGQFNSALIGTLTQKPSRPKIDKIYTPIRDPDLRSITPKVKRKFGTANLHERMVYQMRDTDSYDSFLNLMNKHKRQGLIRKAEKQDHNFLCQMVHKRYRFTPKSFASKMQNRKDLDKNINYLWFSQREFKMKGSSRAINRKKMEMYCQSLYRGSSIPRSKGSKRGSCSKLSLAPRRWIQTCPSRLEGDSPNRTLRFYEILDDLTVKDLAPFNAEYPRHDEQPLNTVGWRLLYKLAREDYSGDADNILLSLVSPRWQHFRGLLKKKQKKHKVLRKFDTCTIYNHLHIQSISTRPSTVKSTKLQHKAGNQTKFKSLKSNIRNSAKSSKKALSRELQSIMSQKIEEDPRKKNPSKQNVPLTNSYQKANISNQKFSITPLNSFKKIDSEESKQKTTRSKTPSRKLLPNTKDSQKVFQNVTVLPVGVSFQSTSLTERFKKILISK